MHLFTARRDCKELWPVTEMFSRVTVTENVCVTCDFHGLMSTQGYAATCAMASLGVFLPRLLVRRFPLIFILMRGRAGVGIDKTIKRLKKN